MIIVNNKMKKALESPVIWPVAGCIILYILICIVSGSVNARVITSGLKLCVFAMLLGVAQMIVVTSGKGAIDISQKYILTLAAYVSCELMQHNILLYYCFSTFFVAIRSLPRPKIFSTIRSPV